MVVEHLSFEARCYVWWQRLEAAGPELWPLGTNTMHRVADQVQAAVSIHCCTWRTPQPSPPAPVGHLRWPNEGTSSIRGAGHGAAGRLPGVRRQCAATAPPRLIDRAFVTLLTRQSVAYLDPFANRASDAVGARRQYHAPDGRRGSFGRPEDGHFRSDSVVGHRATRRPDAGAYHEESSSQRRAACGPGEPECARHRSGRCC